MTIHFWDPPWELGEISQHMAVLMVCFPAVSQGKFRPVTRTRAVGWRGMLAHEFFGKLLPYTFGHSSWGFIGQKELSWISISLDVFHTVCLSGQPTTTQSGHILWKLSNFPCGGFLSHRGTPSHHPFIGLSSILTYHLGVPTFMETPI